MAFSNTGASLEALYVKGAILLARQDLGRP